MKKLLIIPFLLLLSYVVEGQIIKAQNNHRAVVSAGSVEMPSFLKSDGYTLGWWLATDSVVQTSNLVRRWGDYTTSVGHDMVNNTAGTQPTYVANGGGVNSYLENVNDDESISSGSLGGNAYPNMLYVVINIPDDVTGSILGGWPTRVIYTHETGISIWDGGAFVLADNNYIPGEWSIVRILFNGVNSKLIVDSHTATTGTIADNPSDAFGFGADGYTMAAGEKVKEIILRSVTDNGQNETDILNYLKAKYGLNMWLIILLIPMLLPKYKRRFNESLKMAV